MYFKAVVTDLDGTLLNNQSQITPFTINVLNKIADKGVEVVFATGRHPKDAANFTNKLDYPITTVGLNGALCYQSNMVLVNHIMDNKGVNEIAKISRSHKTHFNAFDESGWILFEANDMADNHVKASSFNYRIISPRQLASLRINKVLLWHAEDVSGLEHLIKKQFGDLFEYYRTSPQQLEIGPANISKATEVTKILAKNDICLRSQTVAFGDSENDIELLRLAAHGVLMSNASNEIKKLLDTLPLAHPHHADGVALYLQNMYSL